MSSDRYGFDVEVFKNFFCVTFANVDRSDLKTFIIWKVQDDRKELLEFLYDCPFLISFNGISYDMPILRFIRDYKGRKINEDIHKLSSRLISDSHMRDEDIVSLRYPRYPDYTHQDLMAMMAFNKTGVGLKQCSVNLKWHRIQDLPLHYNHIVTPEDVHTIVDYNINDVLITLELYNEKTVKQYRELREKLVDQYGEKILSASKSKMANILLETMYAEETGIDKRVFKEGRSHRADISFKDVIFPNIKFETPELQNLLNELLEVTVSPINEYKFKKFIVFRNNKYNLGIGGLHTDEKPAKYISTDDEKILSMDVSSFYPAIMCEYGVKPEHLKDAFLAILSRVMKERLLAKKTGDKIKAESYKILINSVFGKLGFPEYWCYDPLAMIRVTLNGQLFLLMLAEKMEQAGIKVVTGNTDGFELLVPKHLESKAYELAKEWENETHFELEFVNYAKLIKRDVNNYIAQTDKGEIKEKGAFLTSISLEKGYKHPIIPKAVEDYFLKDIPVEETIKGCTSILDFCISQKSGKEFQMEYHNVDGVQKLQKTNRFYISNRGGTLQKRKHSTNKLTGLFVGKRIQILNNYDKEVPFEEYDVNLNWYIKEAQSMVEEIEPTTVQQSLFAGMDIDWGKRLPLVKTDHNANAIINYRNQPTQKDILEAHRTKRTFDVSARYGLVTSVRTGEKMSPIVEFYSLLKGTKRQFKIPKAIFTNHSLNVGDVVHLSDFEERSKRERETFRELDEKEWWLVSYAPVSDPTTILEKQE